MHGNPRNQQTFKYQKIIKTRSIKQKKKLTKKRHLFIKIDILHTVTLDIDI